MAPSPELSKTKHGVPPAPSFNPTQASLPSTMFDKYGTLYRDSGSYVPKKDSLDEHIRPSAYADARLDREEAIAHLAHVRRERRAEARASPTRPRPTRPRTKLDEAVDRMDREKPNAKVRLSVSNILASEHVGPFTIQGSAQRTEPLPSLNTPPPSAPRTPATPKKSGASTFGSSLLDSPGVSIVSPHFTDTAEDDEPLPPWMHSSLPSSARRQSVAKDLRRRATSEGILVAKSAEAAAVRAHIADCELREACAAARKAAPKKQKKRTPLAAIKGFLKSVKGQLPSRAKRSLNAQVEFR